MGEACNTAEATRGHYACVRAVVCGLKLADPGITMEPQKGSHQRNPGRLIFSLQLLSHDEVRLWMCVEPLPTLQRLEVSNKQLLIETCLTTGMHSETCATRAFTIDPLSGQQMSDHTRPSLPLCSMEQTSNPAGTASRCRRNRFSADGNMNFKLLFFAGEQP